MPAISRPSSRSSVSPASALAGDAAVEHHDDPVGERLDLVELDRDEQDRLAAVAQRDDLLVDELDGADVDAAGRLADQQHLGVALHLAGDDDLLLVAAGEVGGLQVAGRRADVEALDARRGRGRGSRSRSSVKAGPSKRSSRW